MTQPLTTHLQTINPSSLNRATTHPFLRLAGSGSIPKPLLAKWLSQDRLYAQSYVRFIGLLLAKVDLPRMPSATRDSKLDVNEKVLGILVDAITNIQEELGFFEAVALEYGLDLNTPFETESSEEVSPFSPSPITHAYIDMFMAAGSPGVSLLEGLVVLWATEICYLKAWRFAAGFLEGSEKDKEGNWEEDRDGGALRKRFIPNWSSEGFEDFVRRIGGVVDEFAKQELQGAGADGKGERLGRCERWWRQVVWLEERFWPDVDI
ncbi:hypothetical protein BDV12DRAFT_208922 [Aspergillus spectabilis]